MKYWAPINSPGGINGNDPYVNGNPSTGVQGSIPTYQSFEQTLRELQNLVLASGLTPDAIINGIQIAQSVQNNKVKFANDTGTASALAVTLNPVPVIVTGMTLVVKTANANGANPSINVNGAGPIAIINPDGSSILASTWRANEMIVLCFDGAHWQLISYPGISAFFAFGATYVEYNSGTGTFVVPSGITVLTDVALVGAGGGGGGSQTTGGMLGGGGNGGFWSRSPRLAVTPGQSINWAVGAGGTQGTSASVGGRGGDTTFGTLRAVGGYGGASDTGAPGLPWDSGSTGTVLDTGQQGFTGWTDGTNTHGGNGGGSPAGGFGGQGALNGGTNGNPGVGPGGAGGGGSSGSLGGPGNNGRISFRY